MPGAGPGWALGSELFIFGWRREWGQIESLSNPPWGVALGHGSLGVVGGTPEG